MSEPESKKIKAEVEEPKSLYLFSLILFIYFFVLFCFCVFHTFIMFFISV